MKKTYIEPEIEYIEVTTADFLASSFENNTIPEIPEPGTGPKPIF